MKKIIVCGFIAMMLCALSGCENVDSDLSGGSNELSLAWEESFTSVDELAEFIIEHKDEGFKPLFEKLPDPYRLIVYKFKNIPDNYNLHDIIKDGNFISMHYLSEETEMYEKTEKEQLDNIKSDLSETSESYSESSEYEESSDEGSDTSLKNAGMGKISFIWGYNTDGKEYLKNAIKVFELSEMSDMPGFYYSVANDDYGVLIYQIYWEEDGYCFQLNIPEEIFENSADFMELEKTKYDVPLD